MPWPRSATRAPRVLVIGHVNDVTLYRQFIQRGVSDYLMAPVRPADPDRGDLRPVHGAGRQAGGPHRGGLRREGRRRRLHGRPQPRLDRSPATRAPQTVIADLDIAFGTACAQLQPGPAAGHRRGGVRARAPRFEPGRAPAVEVQRQPQPALGARQPRPHHRPVRAGLRRPDRATCARAVPCVVLDVPHQWTAWSKRVLTAADEILIVAEPDLACLRNTKNLLGAAAARSPERPAAPDPAQRRRRAQAARDRRRRVRQGPGGADRRHDPVRAALFGTAANNGQMIAEIQAGSKAAEMFTDLAAAITRPARGRGARARTCSSRCWPSSPRRKAS